MNKRQRKKQRKREIAEAERTVQQGLRAGLSQFLGQRLTPTQQMKIVSVVGDFISSYMSRPSFASEIFLPRTQYIPPFRKWRALGAHELTHHVGTYPYIKGDGTTIWKRLCDDVTVDAEGILTHHYDEAVTCFGCLAQEPIVHASKIDIGPV